MFTQCVPVQAVCLVSWDAFGSTQQLYSAGLTERQQLALALEESKKAAAALQAKDRQASRQMDSQVTPADDIGH